jgi:hypothetical protein
MVFEGRGVSLSPVGGKELLTPGAILLGEAVEETAGLQRLTVKDQALLDPFVFQRPLP